MLIERNTLGSLKTAYFEKTFGIDLATAINLVNLYGKSLESNTIDSLDEKSRSEFICYLFYFQSLSEFSWQKGW